jgi:REP element-mobilizing transposase RayT
MARLLRLEFPGACYHVINRGNYRKAIFAPQGAAGAFETCLFEACGRFGWRLHAFVIMGNHFHLALETPDPNLSVGMKWLQGTWAARFNRYRGLEGRPFQGRYRAKHVEPGAAEFRGSSLHWYLSGKRPDCLTADTLLAESGELPDSRAGWRHYLRYLEVLAETDPKERQEKYGSLSRGWCVGSPAFRQEIRDDLRRRGADIERFGLLEADARDWRREREQEWERRLIAGSKALGIDPAALPARKSAPPKVQLAALLKQTTAVSNGWLAARLAMGPPASVSQYVRRFRLAGGDRKRAFIRALSIVNS